MKIAILYTGALRTIRDVLPYFKTNVLEAATAEGHLVDVFAVLQSNDPLHYREANWSDMPFPPAFPSTVEDCKITETWLHEQLTGHLQNLTWFRPNHSLWIKLREQMLGNMNLPEYRTSYLRNSGSLIEYYQMQMAYINLLQYERTHNMTYDYVVRLRPDVMIAHPLTFSWLTWTVEEIRERFLEIQKLTLSADLYCDAHFVRFMNTLYRPTLDGVLNDEMSFLPADKSNFLDWQASNILEVIQSFLLQGPYVVTLRGNVVYMLPRRHMGLLAALGTTYGLYNNLPENNLWWWNSESQFQSICLEQRLTIFEASTLVETQSLYQYETPRYYDQETGLAKKDPRFFYFIKRH
jgi:hypothetical protein